MSGTTISASTSVVLVDTAGGNSPYIVYFPYISSLGRIITVRDNDGFASSSNQIVISTVSGGKFPDNQSTIFINQPYGYISFSVQQNGLYSILNTFAFPTGSESAYVYNVNTNLIGIKDTITNNIYNINASNNNLYFNTRIVGDVTTILLDSELSNIRYNFSNDVNTAISYRQYLAIGSNAENIPLGSIKFSQNGNLWYNSMNGTAGFSNGGRALAINKEGFYVACGNNNNGVGTSNLGFLQWSEDGITWNNSIAPSPNLSVATQRSNVYFNNFIWHAVGSGTDSNTILWSSTGKVWNSSIILPNVNTPGNTYYDASYTTTGYSGLTYGKNLWLVCGSTNRTANSLLYSIDGSNWIPNISLPIYGNSSVYDVVYTGISFIALINNSSGSGNILASSTGSNNWSVVSEPFNNESGYLAANNNITLAITPTYKKYSTNGGYTWSNITNFPNNTTSRPHYDGSIWWVGLASSIYTSITGSNNWELNATTLFSDGRINDFISFNEYPSANTRLNSTISGIGRNIQISSFNTDIISTGSFTIKNIRNATSDSLNILSYNSNAFVNIENLVTSTLQTSVFSPSYIDTENINASILSVSNNLNASTIYISTASIDYGLISELYVSSLYSSDIIMASTLYSMVSIVSSIYISDNLNASTIYISTASIDNGLISELYVSSLYSSDIIMANNTNTNTLTVSEDTILNIAYINSVSTLNTIASTIQLINDDGNLTNLYAQNNKIYFEDIDLTTQGINPTFFKYILQDTSIGPTVDSGSMSVDNDDLSSVATINLSISDANNIIVQGLFINTGIYSILHIINPTSNTDHMYRIDKIINKNSYFTFVLTLLYGNNEELIIDKNYNIFINNIGIPLPPSAPTNIVSVKAKLAGSGFNFTGASVSIPTDIGSYVGSSSSGGTSFYINLSARYSKYNIPAVVGSIAYYTGNGYNIVNVKFGSISSANGATISISESIKTLTVSGLTINNFLGIQAAGAFYSLILTMQFLS